MPLHIPFEEKSLSKNKPQSKDVIVCFEFVQCSVLFTESNNGSGTKTVSFFMGDGNTVAVKSDIAVETIADLNHKPGSGQYLYLDKPLLLRQFFAGENSIFDRIGKYRGQLRFAAAQLVR